MILARVAYHESPMIQGNETKMIKSITRITPVKIFNSVLVNLLFLKFLDEIEENAPEHHTK